MTSYVFLLGGVVLLAVIIVVLVLTFSSSGSNNNNNGGHSAPANNNNNTPEHDTGANEEQEPSTTRVRVRAVNEDGVGLPGVSVSLGSYTGVTSQAEHTWTVSVPPGTYALRASVGNGYDGAYQPQQMDLVVHAASGEQEDVQNVTVTMEGWSSLTPWQTLKDAVTRLQSDPHAQTQETVRVTYSFIPAGSVMYSDPDVHAVEITDHVDGSLETSHFKQEIRDAFAAWKRLLETVFPRLTVTFDEVTEEGSPPLAGPYSAERATVGDIRIGMWHLDTSQQVLAYAYGPNNTGPIVGDMLFNASIDWRRDADVHDELGAGASSADGGFSVQYVAAHEIGHSLGFGHHVLQGSLMAPTAGRSISLHNKFASGFENSPYEQAAARGIFG